MVAMTGGLTRRDFLKTAGAGTAGAALIGASASVAGRTGEYLPEGGSRMNVVLIIVDSLRRDHIGAYGNRWIQTPSLDTLADESLRFTRFYPESLPTIPARRAIHTGMRSFPFRNWHQPGEEDVKLWGWQPIPEHQTTLTETLREAGYSTMLVTDTLHQFRPFYNFHRGFTSFEFIRGQERDLYRPASLASDEDLDRVLLNGPNSGHINEVMTQYIANTKGRRGEEEYFAPRVFSRSMEFLEAAAEQQPFFLTVDAYDPHEPWDPPREYVSLYDTGYDGPEPNLPPYADTGWLSERELQRMKALYAGEITMVDRWLGRFVDRLHDLGLADSTLIFFLSDHGHAFGEHGYVGKSPHILHPEITDVPMMIRHPKGHAAGQSNDYLASTHDIAPTILGALNIESPHPQEGNDLSPLLIGGEAATRDHATAAYHDHVWARDDRHVLISRSDGSGAKLYDTNSDPDQKENIAAGNQSTVEHMFRGYILKDAGGPMPHH